VKPGLGTDGHRGRGTYPVQAVVDRHSDPAYPQDLPPQRNRQCQREAAVGDGAAERSAPGPLYVDMDPLAVIGGAGERVHPVLGDL
jgi:hypothetical protein